MPKHLDLCDLLTTGDFFAFDNTTTPDDVNAVLGPPDCVREDNLLCMYGNGIELTFFDFDPGYPTLILLRCDDLPPAGSVSLTIEPWIISENATLETLTTACRAAGIGLTRRETRHGIRWRTSGGVDLTFEDSRLATFMINYLNE